MHYGKCGSGVYKTVYVVNSSLELVPVGLLGYAYVTLLNSTSIAPSETSTLLIVKEDVVLNIAGP